MHHKCIRNASAELAVELQGAGQVLAELGVLCGGACGRGCDGAGGRGRHGRSLLLHALQGLHHPAQPLQRLGQLGPAASQSQQTFPQLSGWMKAMLP